MCPSPCRLTPASARGLCNLKGLRIPQIPGGPPLIYVIVCVSSPLKGHLVCLLCSAFTRRRYCGELATLVLPALPELSLKKPIRALRALFRRRNRQAAGRGQKNNLAVRSVKTDAYGALNKCQFCAVLLKIARDYPVSMA